MIRKQHQRAYFIKKKCYREYYLKHSYKIEPIKSIMSVTILNDISNFGNSFIFDCVPFSEMYSHSGSNISQFVLIISL